ncbi:MAG: FkbM family methyltransferase [Natrialbaceae archaeon]|nr:FkbM family methyltransferase [Natrialbaceae archaeon]
METIVHRALDRYRSEGLATLTREGKRVILGPFDPVYQRIKPAFTELSVDGASAGFDTTPRSLTKHDFVDDIASERDVLERFLAELRPDDVLYDIGGNVGVYTCLAADRLDSGRIVTFEPSPDACAMLRSNIRHNGIDAEVYQVALSNENGTTLLRHRGSTGHQLTADASGADVIEIETRRGDDLIKEANLPRPTVCKVDIEGAEYLAMDGLRETLADPTCRLVYCEIHTSKIQDIGGTPEELEDLFQECGFDLEYLDERRENYFVRAVR